MMTGKSLWSACKRRRWLRHLAAALALLATSACAGCGGVPKTYYYTLQTPPPPAINDPKTNWVLGVEHFRASEILHDDRIVYYESPTAMNYYQYHRWGADPATMVSEATAQWIDATRVFAEVRMLPAREPVDYTLRGRVFNFEEVDYEGGGKARVGLELTLVRARDRKVVWSARRDAESPIQEKGMAGVVNALNASIAQLLHATLPGLIAQVEQDYSSSSGHSQ